MLEYDDAARKSDRRALAHSGDDGNGVHGLNERQEVRAAYVGRDYLFDLIKAYAG